MSFRAAPLPRAGLLLALTILLSWSACAEEPLNAPWHQGSRSCGKVTGPALEVHRYDPHTFILREGLCTTADAPFMYLLVGEQRALLIDSGNVADARQLNLVAAVQQLVPESPELNGKRPKLLVVHTGGHYNHHAGDEQLRHLPGTEVVGTGVQSVSSYYKLLEWPQGIGHIDLGQRAIDLLPTPGHEADGVTFYDRGTALVFTGDFLYPGRIRVADAEAYRDSLVRLKSWLGNRPVTAFLGAHIEMDKAGRLFSSGAVYHPAERALPMTFTDLDALSGALSRYNGFYTVSGEFTVESTFHILLLFALASLIALAGALGYLRARLPRKNAASPQGAVQPPG